MARTDSDEAKTAVILDVMEIQNALKGKVFSITGHLGRPRAEIVALIKKSGGSFEERPRYGVHYLISNADWTKNSTKGKVSTKFAEAQRHGIKIISERAFYEMIAAQDPSLKDMVG